MFLYRLLCSFYLPRVLLIFDKLWVEIENFKEPKQLYMLLADTNKIGCVQDLASENAVRNFQHDTSISDIILLNAI